MKKTIFVFAFLIGVAAQAALLENVVVANKFTLSEFEPGDEKYDVFPVLIEFHMGEVFVNKKPVYLSANCANSIVITDKEILCQVAGTGQTLLIGKLEKRQSVGDYMDGFSYRKVNYSPNIELIESGEKLLLNVK